MPFHRALLLTVLAGACQRVEAPPPPPATALPAAATPAAQPRASTPPKPICLVPTPEQQPPAAKRAERCPQPAAEGPKLRHGRVEFSQAAAKPSMDVEWATSEQTRARGLMFRTELSENSGMLFSWDEQSIRSFWMKNTCIPLDMLFIEQSGFITGILEQVPVLNEEARSIPCAVAHVLELPAGYCRQHGIVAGQTVQFQLPAVP